MPKAFVEPSRKVFPSWKAKIFPFMFGKLIICVVRRFPMSSPLVPMENARHIMARSLTQGIEGVFEKEVWVT